jgi:uncharacterized protein involved in exopolysaccharide biosynthesis
LPSHETSHAADVPTGMPDDSFAPFAALQTALRFWWFLFLLMTAGGLLGWLFHRANPPVYEAVGSFSASIDFVRTGPLTENEEDLALNTIGSVINSATVLRRVVEQADAEGIETNIIALRQNVVVERRVTTWTIRLRGSDPRRVERLVNIWVDQAQIVLEDSYRSALKAGQLLRVMRSLESCLEQTSAVESRSGVCSARRLTEIQADLSAAGEEYAAAQKASRGLFPGLVPGPVEHAVLSPGPVARGRAQLVLAGCLLGLLVGVLLLRLGFPARWLVRS